MKNYCVSSLLGLFGEYPTEVDLEPSVLFTILFAILGAIHFLIFFMNFSRGHYFWISFVWGSNCVLQLLGFALRAVWSKDITNVVVGLASEVLLLAPSVIFVSFDLILAQRLFTWRHPVGGSRKLFWNVMLGMYGVVGVVLLLTMLASFLPFLMFMSEPSWKFWRKVNMVMGIFLIAYSLTSMILIGLSYLFPPTEKDENLYTYQPWWIESFNTFYFVKPGAAQEAEKTFMQRNSRQRHATRVIAATHHHYNMVEGLTNKRGTLSHNVSMGLIVITSILIFIGSLARCIILFEDRLSRHMSAVGSKVFMYIAWGAFEFIINVLYIVARVDLRFYRPDILPQMVRDIVTVQSYYPSDTESGFSTDTDMSEPSNMSEPSHMSGPSHMSEPTDPFHSPIGQCHSLSSISGSSFSPTEPSHSIAASSQYPGYDYLTEKVFKKSEDYSDFRF